MTASLRSLALPLLQAYLLVVLGSQVLLINGLTQGLHLPKALATDIETADIHLKLLAITTVEFTVDTRDFGLGFVNTTCNNCTMDTDGKADLKCCHSGWASPPLDGLLLRNSGNQYVSLLFSGSANASSWIGGNTTEPSFQFRMVGESTESHASANQNDITESCLSAWKSGSFTEVTTTPQYVCGNETKYDFDFHSNRNEAHLTVKIVVPVNAPRGGKAVTLLVTATSSP